MSWIELQVRAPEELRDAIQNRLFELGAAGVSETEGKLCAYFSGEARKAVERSLTEYLTALGEISPFAGAVTYAVMPVADDNWAEKYKAFYRAGRLTHVFFLKPLWDDTTPVPEGMIPIVMDPGQAFGTGLHASTTLTLRFLETTLGFYPDARSVSLLDVGTGSGILAIAAAKLGAGRIEAIDIDPLAVETAQQNAWVNGTHGIHFSTSALEALTGPFDIVLSNILLETHRELSSQYWRLLRPGGLLVVSGVLGYQRQELTECLTRVGFALDGSEARQEWMAFLFRKARSR